MPSLRRTLSVPSVRSSPYPTSLSSSSNTSSGRTNGHGHRRSSGTETSSRRVLADLEWWRVAHGQHDGETELESEERGPNHVHVTADGAEHPLAGVTLHVPPSPQSPQVFNLPTSQFATLAITPCTPVRRGHNLESSPSVESTPEVTMLPLDGLRLSLADADALLDGGCPPPAITRSIPFFSLRARSFPGCAMLREDFICPAGYADFSLSPLSSQPDLFN